MIKVKDSVQTYMPCICHGKRAIEVKNRRQTVIRIPWKFTPGSDNEVSSSIWQFKWSYGAIPRRFGDLPKPIDLTLIQRPSRP